MKVSEVYQTKAAQFLNTQRAEELKLLNKSLTITNVDTADIKDKTKIVVAFEETDNVLVLNQTNARILAEEWGDDTDEWIGKKLQLIKVKRTFANQLVDAIQVVPLNIKEKAK